MVSPAGRQIGLMTQRDASAGPVERTVHIGTAVQRGAQRSKLRETFHVPNASALRQQTRQHADTHRPTSEAGGSGHGNPPEQPNIKIFLYEHDNHSVSMLVGQEKF